jgi:hypothetical protein
VLLLLLLLLLPAGRAGSLTPIGTSPTNEQQSESQRRSFAAALGSGVDCGASFIHYVHVMAL